MGYYVNTVACHFRIKKENLGEAHRLLCELNERDDLKTGGNFPPNLAKPKESTSAAGNPNRWFSWMPWNYDELCADAAGVLTMVGFDVEQDDNGICGLSYEAKTGCEDDFLAAVAPVVEQGSYIDWEGEDYDDRYRFLFEGGKMRIQHGTVVYAD